MMKEPVDDPRVALVMAERGLTDRYEAILNYGAVERYLIHVGRAHPQDADGHGIPPEMACQCPEIADERDRFLAWWPMGFMEDHAEVLQAIADANRLRVVRSVPRPEDLY
jgi:hypothetical protein